MQGYVRSGIPVDFNYSDCKNRFGFGRTHIFLTALPIIRFALHVENFNLDGIPTPPANGGVLSIAASSYHHHFQFNADQVPNVGEQIFCGTIPRKCFYTCTVQQFEAKAKNKEIIGWDLNNWLSTVVSNNNNVNSKEEEISPVSNDLNVLRHHDGQFAVALKD